MSAEKLRRAAKEMREDARSCGREEHFKEAVADWLDSEFDHQFGPTEAAINVARAYLGEA